MNLPELNSRLIFINQNKEELYFDVVKSESTKELHLKGNWVYGSTKYFYYDEQKIFLRSTLLDFDDNHRYLEIQVKKWPVKFEEEKNLTLAVISKESRLSAYIEHSSFNNTGPNSYFKYFEKFTNLTIGNKVYRKVKKLDLSITASLKSSWPLPSLNYIYFDINEGIIGFDDRNGNEWRLN